MNIKNLVDGYSKDKALHVSGTDANKLGVVISNAEGNAVRTDSSSQGSDGTYRTAYTIQNEIGVDGQYTAVASDVAGNQTTVTFTVDREAQNLIYLQFLQHLQLVKIFINILNQEK